MSSSLRKLIARVRSFLKGTLRDLDDAVIPHRHIIYLDGSTEVVIALFRKAFGDHQVQTLVEATSNDSRAVLCLRATRDEIDNVIRTIPMELGHVSVAPLSEEASELSKRRLYHSF